MKVPKVLFQMVEKKNPRAGFEGLLYFEICNEACAQVKKMRAEVKKLHDNQPRDGKLRRSGPKERDLSDKIRKQEAIAITFAAMCLEACIWDYVACTTSQNKAEENFGSLNLKAKWVVIPQFFCGSDITKVRVGGTCLLGMLDNLAKERNKLVHSKSTVWPVDQKKFIELLFPKRKITAEDAFGLIKLLLGELEKVDKSNWWFFEKDAYRHSIKG